MVSRQDASTRNEDIMPHDKPPGHQQSQPLINMYKRRIGKLETDVSQVIPCPCQAFKRCKSTRCQRPDSLQYRGDWLNLLQAPDLDPLAPMHRQQAREASKDIDGGTCLPVAVDQQPGAWIEMHAQRGRAGCVSLLQCSPQLLSQLPVTMNRATALAFMVIACTFGRFSCLNPLPAIVITRHKVQIVLGEHLLNALAHCAACTWQQSRRLGWPAIFAMCQQQAAAA